MNNKQIKFENPLRLGELRPIETLERIGMQGNHVLCDIGAGTGVFTIPAAKMTDNTVYALEINDEMLSIIQEKAKNEGLNNIRLVKVDNDHFHMEDKSVDIVLMVTVFHEINDKSAILEEIKNILKDDGKLAIIDFHKRETPLGPPTAHRIAKDEVKDIMMNANFTILDDFDLGDNFYCLVFAGKEWGQIITTEA